GYNVEYRSGLNPQRSAKEFRHRAKSALVSRSGRSIPTAGLKRRRRSQSGGHAVEQAQRLFHLRAKAVDSQRRQARPSLSTTDMSSDRQPTVARFGRNREPALRTGHRRSTP